MTIEINYRLGETRGLQCVAWASVRGEHYTRVGRTWGEARRDLIAHIKEALSITVPEREQVTIELEEEQPTLPTLADQVAGFQQSIKNWVDPEGRLG